MPDGPITRRFLSNDTAATILMYMTSMGWVTIFRPSLTLCYSRLRPGGIRVFSRFPHLEVRTFS